MIAHSLKAEGFDASEDGTGRGIPLTVGTLSESSGHARPGDNIQSVDYLIPDVARCLQERDAKGADSDTKQGHLIIANALTNSRSSTQCPNKDTTLVIHEAD